MHIFIRIKNEVQIPIVVTQLLLKMYRGVCSYRVSNIYEIYSTYVGDQ